jgi:hypothetical protein
MVKNEETSRKIASGLMGEEEIQAFSTNKEIKEFLDQNNCVVKVLDTKTGDLLYKRNLNMEIAAGLEDKFLSFQTKTYIEDARDGNGDQFANIYVSQSVKDFFGEEIHIAMNIDKQPLNFKRPLFNTLYINNSTAFFRENSEVWNSEPTLVGVDFAFKLAQSRRHYVFRCDAK